ncbi:MAG: LamG-like jellyroll fold domain-containing protein, partial [Phocaeicola sp.]
MKTRKWSFYWAIALTVLCSWSCTEWGLTDPPAGNQIYPKLEQKGVLDFEEELLPETFTLMAYSEGEIPTIISDAEKGKVLQLQGGYAQISNPLYGVKVQTGLSLTFWAKSEANNSGALFSFASEDNADKLFFTPSLELSYTGSPQNINLHTASTSSLLDDESWHYVAISVKNDGFLLHVDGKM